HDKVPVRRDSVGGELFHVVPFDELPLLRLAPRRLDAEDALVDEVAALLRVREDLFEQPERELSLTRRALREPGDVVLHGGRTDLVERDGCEGVEVRQDLTDARERRGADAERIPVEPTVRELGERLRRRLVERAERRAALPLEHEAIRILLQHERSRALVAAGTNPPRAVALAPVPQPVRLDVRHRYSNSLGC